MHDSTHEYDENCPGCQPAIFDQSTGKVLPADSPEMVLVLKIFNEQTTLTEKRAWHRVVFQNSRNEHDLKIAQKIANMVSEAFKDAE